ncbi:hypothetical protein MMC07_002252 [Pseudocyphellaria aurata]|nr:hypothetical protein [Pseudocyphellaria aurata]
MQLGAGIADGKRDLWATLIAPRATDRQTPTKVDGEDGGAAVARSTGYVSAVESESNGTTYDSSLESRVSGRSGTVVH